MSKVRNDLFNNEDIVEDDLVEIEIDNNLQIIGDAYCQIMRFKNARYATSLLLDYLAYDTDLLNLNDIKDWLREQ